MLVAGATGGVGSQVVQCLCNEGINVRALVRDYTKVVWPLYLPVPIHETNTCFGSDQLAMMLCKNSFLPRLLLQAGVMSRSVSALQNSGMYSQNVEIVKGDVYQYMTLPAAMKGWCDLDPANSLLLSSLSHMNHCSLIHYHLASRFSASARRWHCEASHQTSVQMLCRMQ